MNLFEKLNRLDDSLVEAANSVKLEVKYETYGRYGDGGDIKIGRISGSTEVEALMKMLNHIRMYVGSDYAEEFKEENGRYPTVDEIVDELYSQNGDGCDLIYWIRNMTTGEMIFDGAIEDSEPEEWDDDIDETLTESYSSEMTEFMTWIQEYRNGALWDAFAAEFEAEQDPDMDAVLDWLETFDETAYYDYSHDESDLDEKLSEPLASNEYELIYHKNSTSRDRRKETIDDVHNDWTTVIFRADSDLDAWKEAFERVTGDDYTDYLGQDARESDFVEYFKGSDWGDGSSILIKLSSSDSKLYDTGYTLESWIDEFVEHDYDHDIDEMLTESIEDDRKKLFDAAASVRCKLDDDTIEYAMHDVDDFIKNELIYCGKLLLSECPDMLFWRYVSDENFGGYCAVYESDEEFADAFYQISHDRVYDITDEVNGDYDYDDTIDEVLTEGNNVSSQLPPAIDDFLQDVAQMYGTITYKDIMEHEYSEEDLRKLKNYRRRFRAEIPYEDNEETDAILKDISEKVALIVKR